MFINNKGQVITIEKSAENYEKLNTTGSEENLFRLVPVAGRGVRVLPLELVPVPGHSAQISARHQQRAMFRLVPVPGHGAQISARHQQKAVFRLVPVPGYGAQISARHQQKAVFRLVPVPGHGAQISARHQQKAVFRLMWATSLNRAQD